MRRTTKNFYHISTIKWGNRLGCVGTAVDHYKKSYGKQVYTSSITSKSTKLSARCYAISEHPLSEQVVFEV